MEGDYTNALLNVAAIEDLKQVPNHVWDKLLKATEQLPSGNSRYAFVEALARGGQGCLVIAEDRKNNNQWVVVKWALPDLLKKDGWWVSLRNKYKKPESPFIQGETELARRFSRGVMLQAQVNKIVNKDKLRGIGYVPMVLETGRAPKAYFVMEFVASSHSLMEWAQENNDLAKLRLFSKMLLFVEKALHDYQIVHADLAPDNWMVSGDVPILIDFGIAKNIGDKANDVTHFRSNQGKILFSSDKQFRKFKFRDYSVDIFTLGIVLWCLWISEIPEPVLPRAHWKHWDIFPPNALPDGLREIYVLATTETHKDDKETPCYRDISEFRNAIDRFIEEKFGDKELILQPVQETVDWSALAEYLKDKPHGAAIWKILKGLENFYD